jgi:hypothetical protein
MVEEIKNNRVTVVINGRVTVAHNEILKMINII